MIKLYNTMTKKMEEFKSIKSNEVSMYVCGPTVYNFIHIGNSRPVIFFDVVKRYFEYKGYKVNFVQNFTDIDDKMIKKANEEGITVKELAERYIKEYFQDTKALNIKEEGVLHPKATENINEMIKLVKGLQEKGYAYEIDGDVYFDVERYNEYGKLSNQNIEELKSGARIDINESKRSPLDFTLWKKAKPNEPKWASPWGEGRPGWHLECSVMSIKNLGETFDIHGGGQDLIFPHHENEIAQSECYTGKKFANYWLHNGYINTNGEKMSKSKGNFFLLRDILKQYEGRVVRFFMVSSHYRNPIEFGETEMEMAKNGLTRIENTVERIIKEIEKNKEKKESGNTEEAENILKEIEKTKEKFENSMNEDFNTAMAIGAIFELVKEVNKFIDAGVENLEGLFAIEKAYKLIVLFMEDVLGVKLKLETDNVSNLTKELLDFIVDLRWEAKQNKNWELCDKIRDKLLEMKITLKDGKDGTIWKM